MMPQAIVKPGFSHRVKSPGGGNAVAAAGSIVFVIEEELVAFADKLELYDPGAQTHPPVLEDEDMIIPALDVTDAARALAEDYGVDLYDVDGSGQDGRILVADVRAYIDEEYEEEDLE